MTLIEIMVVVVILGILAAVVVPRPGASITPDEIRDYVKGRIAPYKYPRVVRLVSELPKTNTGKILKRSIAL